MEDEVYEKSIFDEEQMPVIYASFWERFGALFLDGLVLAPLSFINAYNRTSWNSIIVMLIASLASLIYKPLMEYLYGATLGKKALSIVVTDKTYGKPGIKEALLRNIFGIAGGIIGLVFSVLSFSNYRFDPTRPMADYSIFQSSLGYSYIVSSIAGLTHLVDIIVFLADKQNRALHDFIGGTYVIKK